MKTKKSARKYAASGKLKKEIQARHKHQQVKKRIEKRKGRKANGKEKPPKGHRTMVQHNGEDENDGEEDVEMTTEDRKGKLPKQKRNSDQEESEDGFLSGTGVRKSSFLSYSGLKTRTVSREIVLRVTAKMLTDRETKMKGPLALSTILTVRNVLIQFFLFTLLSTYMSSIRTRYRRKSPRRTCQISGKGSRVLQISSRKR